jgi:hypothetical protein
MEKSKKPNKYWEKKKWWVIPELFKNQTSNIKICLNFTSRRLRILWLANMDGNFVIKVMT